MLGMLTPKTMTIDMQLWLLILFQWHDLHVIAAMGVRFHKHMLFIILNHFNSVQNLRNLKTQISSRH